MIVTLSDIVFEKDCAYIISNIDGVRKRTRTLTKTQINGPGTRLMWLRAAVMMKHVSPADGVEGPKTSRSVQVCAGFRVIVRHVT